MRRNYGTMGNRLAPQRDDMDVRRDLDEEKKRARREAMMKRLAPNAGGGY
jgi:hypothetical protein